MARQGRNAGGDGGAGPSGKGEICRKTAPWRDGLGFRRRRDTLQGPEEYRSNGDCDRGSGDSDEADGSKEPRLLSYLRDRQAKPARRPRDRRTRHVRHRRARHGCPGHARQRSARVLAVGRRQAERCRPGADQEVWRQGNPLEGDGVGACQAQAPADRPRRRSPGIRSRSEGPGHNGPGRSRGSRC